MKYIINKGATNQILPIFLQSSLSSYGVGATGIVPTTSGLVCFYKRNTDSSLTQINLVSGVVGTYIASGLVPISPTIAPGDMELCLPNAAFANGADFVTATIMGPSNLLPCKIDIQLIDAPLSYVAISGINSNSFARESELTVKPSFPSSPIEMIKFLFTKSRHTTVTNQYYDVIYKQDGVTPFVSGSLSDDGTNFTKNLYS